MVFQNYALYPHMTVRENLGFGLSIRKQPAAMVEQRVRAVAGSLGLDALLDRKPAQLSGGQRQRVALGRAIVREPLAFLFDEPLSNLDAQLRVETRVELSRLHRQLAATMVYVTHDQSEALTLGDRIAVLRDGVLQQVASPMELYSRPANRFVGGFIGSPAMNFLEGSLHAEEGTGEKDGRFTFQGSGFAVSVQCDTTGSSRAVLGVRPQHLEVVADGDETLRAEVTLVEPMGNEQIVYASLPGGERLVAVAQPEPPITPGTIVALRVRGDAVHVFDAASGARLGRR